MSTSDDERTPNSIPPSDTVTLAAIGLGPMGRTNLVGASGAGARIVALCDVDETLIQGAQETYPDAAVYTDYRRLLEKEKGIDGVIVSTPNHTHAVIAIAAMELGKHVYCEKPLAHTMTEVRRMMQVAKESKVVTQMGNQGHSYETNREFFECIRSGTIGEVREVHLLMHAFNFSLIGRPLNLDEDHPVPETLDWDLWLGPAPYRKYNPIYHPGSWRCIRPFSSGLVGDMFCHIADPVFWALNLGSPTSVSAEAEGYDPKEHGELFPRSTKTRIAFPARDQLPPVTMYWYDGDQYTCPRPEELGDDEDFVPGLGPRSAGGYVIGSKGKAVYGSHGAAGWRLIPESRMAEYMDGRTPAADPRRLGAAEHPDVLAQHQDWLQACREGRPAGANFAYGGVMTEAAILGNIAQQMAGTDLQWDSENMTFPHHPEANQHLHYTYREGWAL